MEANDYFDHDEPVVPIEQTKVFNMIISMGESLVPCDVFFATMEGGNTFTRVIMYPSSKTERVLDLDKQNEQWICIYEMEPTIWSQLVTPSLDYHIAQRTNEQNKQN